MFNGTGEREGTSTGELKCLGAAVKGLFHFLEDEIGQMHEPKNSSDGKCTFSPSG